MGATHLPREQVSVLHLPEIKFALHRPGAGLFRAGCRGRTRHLLINPLQQKGDNVRLFLL